MEKRAELKRAYKEEKRSMGIYQIKNEQNGKTFIGSSRNVKAMINRSIFELRHGSHPNKALQQDWNEQGESKFSLEVLEVLKPREDVPATYMYREELEQLEGKWYKQMEANEQNSYNQ